MKHKVGIKHGRNVCKTARAVKRIKSRKMRMTASECEYQTVVFDNLGYLFGRLGKCPGLLDFYCVKIVDYFFKILTHNYFLSTLL